ncbi:MAG: FAD-dependent oxidoreductase [Sedimentisphaerales bacterium]|nr:FAD-dependent oxidoreductase [Sedimentisphaerales bacterium]
MEQEKKIGSAMIIGAGISGIQAALDLADSGYKVFLVDSSTAIGGRMAQLDKTFPTNDCAMCTISPRLVAAGTHRNIEIITNTRLAELSGKPGNFKAKIISKPNFVDLEKCTGCGECADNCPVVVKDEYNQLLDDRKAIYKKYPQAVPNKFAMTRDGVPPCHDSCPIHGNPCGYIALTSSGRYQEAFESAAEKNPFPSICGRICEHPCEQDCNRNNLDSPVSIAYIKRFLADWYDEHGEKLSPADKQASIVENSKKIAVIGAGPAGLTAALELRKAGFKVTVFEKHSVPGGMMRLGVPEYRLPEDVIQRDIQGILDYGVEIKYNSPVKSQDDIQAFFDDGYKAVFLSVGSHISAMMGMKGEDLENISSGIDFLREIRLGTKKSVKENVIVIGGGNVAMDCARSALRLGARRVDVVCLEEDEKMPAYSWEVAWAKEEGIIINDAKATKAILEKDGRFAGLELLDVKKMAFVEGRLELETVAGSESVLNAEEMIVAIGQKPGLNFLGENSKIELTPRRTIKVDENTGMTSWKGVFAGGDVIRGAASVVQATADGQRAAKAIIAYANNEPFEPAEEDYPVVTISAEELKERKEKSLPRQEMPVIPLDRRISTFEEVDLGFTEEMVKAESERCLYCAICSSCGLCEKICEADAINFNDSQKEKVIDVGAIILAPGFDLYDAAKKGEYGYRRFPNVLSGLDYERISSASGPFQGHIQRVSDGKEPRKMAFIQCVGSRDKDNPYCSSVCCMYATKQAIVTKEHLPDLECKIFVMDVRAFGKGFDEYYERAKEKYGIEYIYTRPSSIKQNFKTKDLSIQFTKDGKEWVEEDFDMVVLSSGLCPSSESKELAEVCGIELNEYSFAQSADFDTIASSREGIFLAGAFESPKDIPESVTQASGAAAAVMELLADVRGTQVEDKLYPPEKQIIGLEPRIGVFVCNCGSNIGGVIDCQKISDIAAGLPNVVFSTALLYTCSPDGLKTIKESVEENDVNRVVVASCTPRTHEPLFQEAIKETGLNPYLFEMANIRDQCTWVHTRLGDATDEKALDLVKMAVGRAAEIEPLESKTYEPKKNAIVVGAGVAGMTAAISIANQGYKVHLLEKTDTLGGNLAKVKSTIEGLKPQELLNELTAKINSDPMIEVLTNSTIEHCKGFVGNFKSLINTNGETREMEHGAAIVAIGANESKPTEYLYAQNSNVMTQMELEEKITSDPGIAKGISELVMIQCVGSREADRMICSRVCCTEAIKNAIAVKTQNPKANIAILYRDVRTYGLKEKYYNQAREMGVLFFRYDLDNKPVVTEGSNGELKVKMIDLNSGLDLSFTPDILALSAAMVPPKANQEVGTAFKVPVMKEGFFLEAHMKLRPIDFASDGLFLCGTCHSPRFIDETIAQAKAAAAKAVSILSRKQMQISGIVSVVEQEKCAACLTCVRTCPYNVPFINSDGLAEIEAALCHGCGICASECPAKAIQLMHYKDKQMVAKTEALFASESKK